MGGVLPPIGEPFSGPLFPTHDKRNPFWSVHPQAHSRLREIRQGAVLRGGTFRPAAMDWRREQTARQVRDGPEIRRRWYGGQAHGHEERDGRPVLHLSVEGSALHHKKGLPQTLRFKEVHHAVFALEGNLRLVVHGAEVIATAGEPTFLPAGTPFSFGAGTVFAKAYFFANGVDVEVLTSVGSPHDLVAVPEETDVRAWDTGKLSGLAGELGFELL